MSAKATQTFNINDPRPIWEQGSRPFTDTPISLERLCATAQLVGIVRGLLDGGALDDLPKTKKCALDALAKYEAAQ